MAISNEALEKRFALHEQQIFNTTLKAGLAIGASFIGFFLIMRLFDLETMLWMRSFNGVFLLAGLYLVLRQFKNKVSGKLDYLEGIRLGLRTTIIALIPFTLFMFFTLTFNTDFMQYIQNNAWCGSYMTPVSSAGMLLIEGLVSGFMMTYVMMMLLKKR